MKLNYRMLRIARESRGLTQKQLVERVEGLNQGNYSRMEKGLLSISDDTFLKIRNVLRYKESFFFKPVIQTPISSFYYRRRVRMPRKELTVLEAKLDILRIMVDELLESVEIPELAIPTFEVDINNSPSKIAAKVRDSLKIPKGPINNLIEKIEAGGIIIYFINTPILKFDGITLVTDKRQPIIFVNSKIPNDRKIFTIAHELGHYVMHVPFSPLPNNRDEEKEANEFAGEFLMPYLDCREDLRNLNYRQLDILKAYWKVSKVAILRRALEIKMISKERYTYLNIELSRNGEKKRESGFIELAQPKLMKLMVKTHQEDLEYSQSEMLELLGLDERDYFSYFNESQFDVSIKNSKVVNLFTRE